MKLALSVTFSASTLRCSTTILRTRSAISLIFLTSLFDSLVRFGGRPSTFLLARRDFRRGSQTPQVSPFSRNQGGQLTHSFSFAHISGRCACALAPPLNHQHSAV